MSGARLGAGVLGLLGLAWAASALSTYDVVADVHPALASRGPSLSHLLGTDHLGRDVLCRLWLGVRAFVGPGLIAGAVAGGLSALLGGLGALRPGALRAAVRALLTVVASVPRFALVLLIASIFGDEPAILAAAAGLAYLPALVEDIFARVAELEGADFVEAARAHGVPAFRVVAVHLLWVGCRHLILRHLLQLFAFVVVLEASLSFIGGFGVEEPTPSWGNMIAFELSAREGNLWAWLAPALCIQLAVVGTLLAAEGVRDGG